MYLFNASNNLMFIGDDIPASVTVTPLMINMILPNGQAFPVTLAQVTEIVGTIPNAMLGQ